MINSGWEVGQVRSSLSGVVRRMVADICAVITLLAVLAAMWVH